MSIPIIGEVVGYMYKVKKNGLDISDFHQEFAAIRHGDYYKFFNIIRKEINFILVYEFGQISKSKKIEKNEPAFTALLKSAESMKDFYQRCKDRFGVFSDQHFSNEDFRRAAMFEISLRIHANDMRLPGREITLENIINSMKFKDSEKIILHNGRRFINHLKRPKKLKESWNKVFIKFNEAYELLELKDIIIKM